MSLTQADAVAEHETAACRVLFLLRGLAKDEKQKTARYVFFAAMLLCRTHDVRATEKKVGSLFCAVWPGEIHSLTRAIASSGLLIGTVFAGRVFVCIARHCWATFLAERFCKPTRHRRRGARKRAACTPFGF